MSGGPSQDTGGNTSYYPSSCNINDISLISVYWSDIINKPSFCNISITGSYNDLINIPSLCNVAFSGDYNSLSNKTWINSDSNIYNNNSGNIGIGTANPNSKLHLIGNLSITGDIIPTINSNFNLGNSEFKWKDIYLSGNSIYLDDLILSKNNSNNLEIKDSNNNFRNFSANSIILNNNNDKLTLELSNGSLFYTSNNTKYSSIPFTNYSQIIYSNVLSNTSNSIINYTNDKIANINLSSGGTNININTDTITIGTSNKFITNNIYNSNITFTSNLNVNGNYQLNNCNIPFSLMKYSSVKSSNGTFNYNSTSNDYAYFSFVNNGSITFSQAIQCDILVVGAGGNGGSGALSGGGGAGEIILYPSYPFSNQTYNINIGIAGTNSNLRTSTITSNNNEILLRAKGGGDGSSLTSNISSLTSNIIINNNAIFEYNYTDYSNISSGTYDFLFNNGSIITYNKTTYNTNYSYPILLNINPISWYKFDNGDLLTDSGTGGYNLTNNSVIINTTNFSRGNASANFNSAGWFSVSTSLFNNLTNYTISFWIFLNALGSYIITSRQHDGFNSYAILSIGCFSGSGGAFTSGTSGKIYYHSKNSVSNAESTTILVINKWNFITIVATGSNCLIYINGSLDSTTNADFSLPDVTSVTNSLIGSWRNSTALLSASINLINGNIDDFRVYNIALTQAQITELYNGIVRIYSSKISGGSGGGSYANLNSFSFSGDKWNTNFSYISNGSNGTLSQGGNGGFALSNIGLFTNITGNSLIVGEGGSGATSSSTPVIKTNYGSGGDGNGGIGTNGLVIVKIPLDTCNAKFDGFIYTSNIFDLNLNTITNMSLASNQLYSSVVNLSNQLINYDNLINEPWINSGLNIYNFNQGNIGIGKTNPSYKLDINGDINISGNFRLNTAVLPFSVYSNTNIITSNGLFSYIPNNYTSAYYTFLTNGSITFPQTTLCDILVVAQGGNGGVGPYTGGGGAGEVIALSSYSFSSGIYNIQMDNSNSIISSNNTNIITARGGNSSSNIVIESIIPTFSGDVISATATGSSDTYYMFRSGTSTFTISSSITCDILVVGGGGGGGSRHAGGGGAGALIYETNKTLNAGTYTINIGAGGSGGNATGANVAATNGGDTSISLSGTGNIYLAKGGGYGGSHFNGNAGSGGSGGGNGASGNVGNAVTTNIPTGTYGNSGSIGNAGGTNNTWIGYAGGGGGGAGSAATNFTLDGSGKATGGSGGNGRLITIRGINEYFAGGGGGGVSAFGNAGGSGGLGGGGAGSLGYVAGNPGQANTGGGGGGSGFNDQTNAGAAIAGGAGGSGVVIIRVIKYTITSFSSIQGGSGAGGLASVISNSSNSSNGNPAGTKWNNSANSYVNAGGTGTSLKGGDGGSALVSGGFTENITSTNLIVGVGGTGATLNSIPRLITTYGSGGDGNGGLGTEGIIIIKVPLNIQKPRFDGYINYSNIDNRPILNDLITSTNYLNLGYYNQVNFPLANVAWKNEWFLYVGNSPTNQSNSFIFWHLTSNINSKWWFNGTQTVTNSEISDSRIKKDIIEIQNPLEKLMYLKPKEYYLCDEKDYLKKYGIIAQDVYSNLELNHLVYKDEDYIANIYTKAIYLETIDEDKTKILLITNEIISDKIKVNDELKILLDNMNIDNKEIIIEETPYHNRYKKRYAKVKAIINDYTIEIYDKIELSEIEKENIFIYGKKVDDFNKLDYSSLYSLNIACSQELYKLVQQQKLKIEELEQRIINLENKTI